MLAHGYETCNKPFSLLLHSTQWSNSADTTLMGSFCFCIYEYEKLRELKNEMEKHSGMVI